jgi:3'-phosphoadenosine 5'-phosphosulfate sulfotransferase (PAPS reductase)/FAD synthetase
MDFLSYKIDESKNIVLDALNKYSPIILLLGFSGGKDSTVLFELIKELNFKFTPFHCNTGIAVEETHEFVRRRCKESHLKLIEQNVTYKSYEEMVLTFGFPSAPQHIQMYSNLKEKSIREILRLKWLSNGDEWKNKNKVIITGVRKAESNRRKFNIHSAAEKRGRQIWINPILNWDDDDIEAYISRRQIELNEVSNNIGMSGDCLCGAYAKKGELEVLKKFYPSVAAQIESISERVKEKGFTWGWDDVKPNQKEYIEVMEKIYPGYKNSRVIKKSIKLMKEVGQQDLFEPLCHKCEFKFALEQQKNEFHNERF